MTRFLRLGANTGKTEFTRQSRSCFKLVSFISHMMSVFRYFPLTSQFLKVSNIFQINNNLTRGAIYHSLSTQDNTTTGHWTGLVDSLMISLLLSLLIISILRSALNRDLKSFRSMRLEQDSIDETSWKQLQRDAFRPPKYPMFLSVFVGSGIHLLLVAFFMVLFANFGYFDDFSRGEVPSSILLLYCFFSFFNGLISSRLYKMMEVSPNHIEINWLE
jgi:Endomembrane protein 70